MKKSEVPQEENSLFNGAKKALYALDEDGEYTTIASSGWHVEEVVTGMAVEEFHRLAEEARQRVATGISSPLEFHMYNRRMDPTTLAQSTGMTRWRVKRHLKPGPFEKLTFPILHRYAQALGIDVAELTCLPDHPALRVS